MTAILSDYLTRPELAAELNVTPRTIIRYENRPDGLPHTRIGGRVMYRKASVLAWLEKAERHPNPTRRFR